MIKVVDNFCPFVDTVIDSALEAGFDTWNPNKGQIGTSVYQGMGFWGKHAHMLASLSQAMGCFVYPNSMFFRVTNPETERAYIHSDRSTGAYTCVAYLSDHDEPYGTGFYRHSTGIDEMPEDISPELADDMVSRENFEQTQFVEGKYNRAVIFSAPLFHSRMPETGFAEGRMVWVSHFHTPQSLLEAEYG